MKLKNPRKNSGRQPLHEAFNSSVKGLMHTHVTKMKLAYIISIPCLKTGNLILQIDWLALYPSCTITMEYNCTCTLIVVLLLGFVQEWTHQNGCAVCTFLSFFNPNVICNVYVVSEIFFSFGLTPSAALQVMTPLPPSMSHECSLPLATTGAVQRMEPLNNLQVSEYLQFLPWIFI